MNFFITITKIGYVLIELKAALKCICYTQNRNKKRKPAYEGSMQKIEQSLEIMSNSQKDYVTSKILTKT